MSDMKQYYMTALEQDKFAEEWRTQCSRLSKCENLGNIRFIPDKKSRMYRERFTKSSRR